MPIESHLHRPPLLPTEPTSAPIKTRGFPWPITLVAVIVCLAIIAGIWYYRQRGESADEIIAGLPTAYHAVFLDNGQVYFGRLKRSKAVYRLANVFYFQTGPAPTDTKKPDVALVKLGSEVHGPEDVMEINPQHVLLVEKLRDDSQVVTAIKDYVSAGAE